jgi:hypothetical protein
MEFSFRIIYGTRSSSNKFLTSAFLHSPLSVPPTHPHLRESRRINNPTRPSISLQISFLGREYKYPEHRQIGNKSKSDEEEERREEGKRSGSRSRISQQCSRQRRQQRERLNILLRRCQSRLWSSKQDLQREGEGSRWSGCSGEYEWRETGDVRVQESERERD